MRTAGRRITLLGFLLLSICFFLPQIKACNSPIVPAKDVQQMCSAGRGENATEWLLSFFAPFVLGFLGTAVYTVVNLVRRIKVERVATTVWCVACTVFLFGVLWQCLRMSDQSGSDTPFMGLVATVGVVLTMGLVALSGVHARPFRRLALCTVCCGGASLAYFMYWIVGTALDQAWGDLCYGIWLSATACLLITGGAVMDALAPPPRLLPSVELWRAG